MFDVINFDMVNRIPLPFSPSCCAWAHKGSANKAVVAVGYAESGDVVLFDARGEKEPAAVFKGHRAPLRAIQYHTQLDCMVRPHPCDSSEAGRSHLPRPRAAPPLRAPHAARGRGASPNSRAGAARGRDGRCAPR